MGRENFGCSRVFNMDAEHYFRDSAVKMVEKVLSYNVEPMSAEYLQGIGVRNPGAYYLFSYAGKKPDIDPSAISCGAETISGLMLLMLRMVPAVSKKDCREVDKKGYQSDDYGA